MRITKKAPTLNQLFENDESALESASSNTGTQTQNKNGDTEETGEMRSGKLKLKDKENVDSEEDALSSDRSKTAEDVEKVLLDELRERSKSGKLSATYDESFEDKLYGHDACYDSEPESPKTKNLIDRSSIRFD